MSYEQFRQLVITRAVLWVSNYGAMPANWHLGMPLPPMLPIPPLRWR